MSRKVIKTLAILCATALTLSAVTVGFVTEVVADSLKQSATGTALQFGGNDTYLQLNNPLSATPSAIETEVNINVPKQEYKLFDELNLTSITPNNRKTCGTIGANEGPQTALPYVGFDTGTEKAHTKNLLLGVRQQHYSEKDLALSFWCYNGGEENALLADTGGQLRLSSNANDSDFNFKLYACKNIKLPHKGWNHIVLPLSEWSSALQYGIFDVNNIQSFGISGYNNSLKTERKFTDFKLIVISEDEINSVTEWDLGTLIDSEVDIASVPNKNPGLGFKYYKIEAGKSANVINNSNLNINVGNRTVSDLAVDFWFYNGDSTVTKFPAGQLRISNNTNINTDFIYFQLSEISVKPEWNHIVIPLSCMIQYSAPLKFTETINSFKMTGASYAISNAENCYFTNFKLRVLEESEWNLGNLFDVRTTDEPVPDIENGPEAGTDCYKIDADNSTTTHINSCLYINASKYSMNDLAVEFWYYTKDAEQSKILTDNLKLRISSYKNGVSKNFRYISMNTIDVKSGWNHITLPLSRFSTVTGDAGISLDKIMSIGFVDGTNRAYKNPSNTSACYFTDFKLKAINQTLVTVSDTDAKTLSDNYMIFSNTNANAETAPFALFITKERYPALLYGNKQFTLKQRITSGVETKVSVTRDNTGYINFYINDKFIAKSTETADLISKPVTTHSIGSDGIGSQVMNGSIAYLKVYKDSNKTQVLGFWNLNGNIDNVNDVISDKTENKNDAVFKGSKAENLTLVTPCVSGVKAGVAPKYVPTGYVFAGWFTDKDCKTPLTTGIKLNQNNPAYGKFVDADVLTVKTQLYVDKAESNASIRFVTTVDSLNFQRVGFEISTVVNGNKKTADTNRTSGTTVYKTLLAVTDSGLGTAMTEYKPNEEFSPASAYFKAFTVTGINATKFNQNFITRAFWVTLDGTIVYGSEITRCVKDGFKSSVTYYISDDGTDTEDAGSVLHPMRTVEYALNRLNDGDTLYFKGNYTVSKNITKSVNKKVYITGDTIDYSSLGSLEIRNDTVFTGKLKIKLPDNLIANGFNLKIDEGVTVVPGTNGTTVFGGSSVKNVENTNVVLLSGTYTFIYGGGVNGGNVNGNTNLTVAGNVNANIICGGGRKGVVEGNTNLYLGGNINKNLNVGNHDEAGKVLVFGGAYDGTVKGDTFVKVTQNAKAGVIYGAGRGSSSSVEGKCNLAFDSGTAMGLYGGSSSGKCFDTSVIMNDGYVEQIFGGSNGAGIQGNTDVKVFGGTVKRRIYGGCYNDYGFFSSWKTSYTVSGYTNVLLSSKATLLQNHSSSDNALCAISRYKQNLTSENATLILSDYNGIGNYKLGSDYFNFTNGAYDRLIYAYPDVEVSVNSGAICLKTVKSGVLTVKCGNNTESFSVKVGETVTKNLSSFSSKEITITFNQSVSTLITGNETGDTDNSDNLLGRCE